MRSATACLLPISSAAARATSLSIIDIRFRTRRGFSPITGSSPTRKSVPGTRTTSSSSRVTRLIRRSTAWNRSDRDEPTTLPRNPTPVMSMAQSGTSHRCAGPARDPRPLAAGRQRLDGCPCRVDDVRRLALPCSWAYGLPEARNGPPDIETIDRRRVDPPAGCRATTEPAILTGRWSADCTIPTTEEQLKNKRITAGRSSVGTTSGQAVSRIHDMFRHVPRSHSSHVELRVGTRAHRRSRTGDPGTARAATAHGDRTTSRTHAGTPGQRQGSPDPVEQVRVPGALNDPARQGCYLSADLRRVEHFEIRPHRQ